ncbi:MAG: GatB/YqeY domain-containing protein [Dehalococcoidales bacterium]|nr:GatB/YqeY domain-containing protein [Dehalococcoidales bacterium]
MADSLKNRLSEELKTALKAGDKCRLSVIRLTLAAIKNAEIAKRGDLTEPETLDVISRECKKRAESIEAFEKGNRQDLADKEKEELAVLKVYLPEQLSREEITAAVKEVIEATGAKTMAEKGKVMGMLMPKMRGKADGRLVNEVVEELLQA